MALKPTTMAPAATPPITTPCTAWSGLTFDRWDYCEDHSRNVLGFTVKLPLRYAAVIVSTSFGRGRLTLSADPAAEVTTDAQKTTIKKTIETCAACHGVTGRSISPTFPNLAAQTAPYIELQLHAFKDQSRDDPDAQAYMWGMASQLNDATISGLASYFAAQPAAGGTPGSPALIAQGKKLYEEGVP